MSHPDHFGMVKPTLTLTAYAKDGKELGALRTSRMEVTVEPNSENGGSAKPQIRNFVYVTTAADSPVYEIPLQAVADLENTVNRLHSDSTTPASTKSSATATPGISAPQKQ